MTKETLLYIERRYVLDLNNIIIKRYFDFLYKHYNTSRYICWKDLYQSAAQFLHLDKQSTRDFIYLLSKNYDNIKINSLGLKFGWKKNG